MKPELTDKEFRETVCIACRFHIEGTCAKTDDLVAWCNDANWTEDGKVKIKDAQNE